MGMNSSANTRVRLSQSEERRIGCRSPTERGNDGSRQGRKPERGGWPKGASRPRAGGLPYRMERWACYAVGRGAPPATGVFLWRNWSAVSGFRRAPPIARIAKPKPESRRATPTTRPKSEICEAM
jgi:hypothetical protein